MRYLAVLILAYVVLGLQSGLTPFLAIDGASPNLVLAVVIFVALYAPRDPALLGAYMLGLMQDLLSAEPLGVHALVYAAVTVAVRLTQPILFREHFLTHLVLGLLGGLVQGAALMLAAVRLGVQPSVQMTVSSALYTAAVMPLILVPLQRWRRLFVQGSEHKIATGPRRRSE